MEVSAYRRTAMFAAALSAAPSLPQRLVAAKEGEVIELEAKTYELDSGLLIAVSKLTLVGKGPGKTILRARFKGTDAAEAAIIKVESPDFASLTKGKKRALELATTENDRLLRLSPVKQQKAPPPSFDAGSVVLVRAPNDPAFLDAIGAKAWRKQYPYIRQTLALVTGARALELELEKPLGIAFPKGAELMPAPVLRDVTIKGLTLSYDLGAHPDPTKYENTKPDAIVDGIYVHGALNARIEDVEILDIGRHAIHLDTTLYPKVEKIRASGSWNKGKEGNGYFRIARTYYGEFHDLHLRGLRHLAIQWSSHDNVLKDVDSDCDVNFHGGFTQRNRVENATLAPRRGHTWSKIFRTEGKAAWAPPDGTGNQVLDPQQREIK